VNTVDGVQYLAIFARFCLEFGTSKPHGENLLEGRAPFYNIYDAQDGKYIIVGAMEPHFYVGFVKGF